MQLQGLLNAEPLSQSQGSKSELIMGKYTGFSF